jgi:hypothetical protein
VADILNPPAPQGYPDATQVDVSGSKGETIARAWALLEADLFGVGGRHGLEGAGTARAPWASTLGSGRWHAGDGDAYRAAAREARNLIAGTLRATDPTGRFGGPEVDPRGDAGAVVRYWGSYDGPHNEVPIWDIFQGEELLPWGYVLIMRGGLSAAGTRSSEETTEERHTLMAAWSEECDEAAKRLQAHKEKEGEKGPMSASEVW